MDEGGPRGPISRMSIRSFPQPRRSRERCLKSFYCLPVSSRRCGGRRVVSFSITIESAKGLFFSASADLLNSTSMNAVVEDFPKGYFNSVTNAGARLLSLGGICEDAMSGILSGISFWSPHWCWFLLRRIYCTSQPYRFPFACHRKSGPTSEYSRAISYDDLGLRSRRVENGRGSANSCRSSVFADLAGEFSPRYFGHSYSMGTAGNLASCFRRTDS